MDYYLEETKNINNKPNFARVLELELADVIITIPIFLLSLNLDLGKAN